tara:strand:+ start:1653 stop:1907 length:255 start_codon:yes stop_codon:yes gene_type:complete
MSKIIGCLVKEMKNYDERIGAHELGSSDRNTHDQLQHLGISSLVLMFTHLVLEHSSVGAGHDNGFHGSRFIIFGLMLIFWKLIP